MMRGTTFSACETCYNINEKEYRIIETYEESLFTEAMQTGSECPTAILYLDLGVCPARFVVKKYKLNFLYYILKQEENSFLSRFFKAQLETPTKGGWGSEMKKLIEELEIASSFKEVMSIKKEVNMKKIVSDKLEVEAFKYLKN